ncbi:MAG: TonB C-terminal domain-containing protein [Desulfomonile sp.]|nr:TonB C-terminal domain-containing protein [Desulfomonile sp.]
MKRIVVASIILTLGLAYAAPAAESPGSLVPLVVVDGGTRSKVLNDYTLLTRDAIQRTWTVPLDLETPSAIKGRIRINYTVTRTGKLSSVELVRGSGNAEMDRSLVEAIRRAQPFPAFPDDIRAEAVSIRANFIIADLPTVPVTTVSQDIEPEPQPAPQAAAEPADPAAKKLIWGQPAGSAQPDILPAAPPNAAPAPEPPAKKFKWGR